MIFPFHGQTLELQPLGPLALQSPGESLCRAVCKEDSRREDRARVHGGAEDRGKGRSAGADAALLKGQQVWVRALIVNAGGPRLGRWAAVLQRLGQADGAQAEFEAISLHEARGGGPSALSRLELGVVLAVLVDEVRYRHGSLSIRQSVAPVHHLRGGLWLGSIGWAGLGGRQDLGLPR